MSFEYPTIGKETPKKRVYLKGSHSGRTDYWTIECWEQRMRKGVKTFVQIWTKNYTDKNEWEMEKILDQLTPDMKVEAEVIH